MTNDEAIRFIDAIKRGLKSTRKDYPYRDEYIPKMKEACEDAIKALEILEEFERAQIITGGRLNGRTYAYKCELEDGKKKTEWIPVSERMPEDSELVLFSTKTDRVFEGRYFADNTDRQWYSFRDDAFAWNNVVTAWMLLPEPYKAESENEK